ncbi:type VI secretion system tube protein TssD [Hymenobacter terrenus]|uniref:type VI secretion system tube protein TssD n=1 Tax=Hymenobacter terrenus TaxID=1629124 RepID=UPI000619A0F5|nr:type VI secretion system tube protein TssD [Hymenobacter terrenus]
MGAIYAELHVAGHVYPLLSCHYGVHQAIGERGRAGERVRHGKLALVLDVPADDFLEGWAAAVATHYPADAVFFDSAGGSAIETVSLVTAYCTGYEEEFEEGEHGRYVAYVELTGPGGFTLKVGGPAAAFVAPAARSHGTPPVAALLGAAIGGQAASSPSGPRTLVSPDDVPPHLPAPIPNPSPDHAQVHLSQAEWAALIEGRWDNTKKAKGKKFLKPYHSTEFHVAGDPFTYRVDHTGKMVAIYDAQKSYNVTGSKNGLMAIPLTLNGQPTYAGTPHMFPVTGNQRNVVVIDMVGNRPGDFKAANKAAGLDGLVAAQGRDPEQAPDGYTWHHRDDFNPKAPPNPPYGTCTMELVETEAHEDTFVHKGSCDQCNKHNKKPNKKKLYR